jgi:hypothetical protein
MSHQQVQHLSIRKPGLPHCTAVYIVVHHSMRQLTLRFMLPIGHSA